MPDDTRHPNEKYEMKISQVACAWLLSAILGAASAQAEPAAGRIVRDSVERLAQSSNGSDASRRAAEYWPDGELINISRHGRTPAALATTLDPKGPRTSLQSPSGGRGLFMNSREAWRPTSRRLHPTLAVRRSDDA